ncbi:MAG: hypothetical protein MUC96_13685 [Myxococcaceae bacterium]|jgi:hypothetical protein|nr:hypothetical protein [Myxococcaceae bacterium]
MEPVPLFIVREDASVDELPDARLTPRTEPIPTDVAPLVATLDSLVRQDDVIDAGFRDAWRRHVGC